jgi:hypothetical protein
MLVGYPRMRAPITYVKTKGGRGGRSADAALAYASGVDSVHFSRHYLSCISLVTDFTPPTLLATLTAPAISAREFTKPLN